MTTSELAREVHVTPKTIRSAILRGDLRAVRMSKGTGRTPQATEFSISRAAADEWIARRTTRHTSTLPSILAAQEQRRRSSSRMYFTSHDEDDNAETVADLTRSALAGDEASRERLRAPQEDGGMALSRWYRAGVGEIL